MSKHKPIWKRLTRAGLLLVVALSAVIAAGAPVSAQGVPQGYQSDQPLQKGMIIRLKPDDGSRIQAVTQKDEGQIFGVVVSSADTAVSLSNTEAAQEIFVANSGHYEALVSTQNGPIKTGDYIGMSSLAGVGMKADSNLQFVLGKALNDFDGKSGVEGTNTLKTSTGDKQVSLGRVAIEVAIAHNPTYHKEDQPGVPHILSQLTQVVTDKTVSPFRIYASLAVVVVCIVVAGVVLFAGVRTGMTAVGRNPLAKRSISRGLFQVTLMALIVFVIGIIAVYLLLRI